MRLDNFDNSDFDRGGPRIKEFVWLLVQALLVETWLPGLRWRATILRWFGARIGKGVVIKPYCKVKFPWKLNVGDFTWIGEAVWIDNLAEVRIGSHCCLSQGAYLCTGNHDWNAESFDLVLRPIVISDHAWVGAKAMVSPGVSVGQGAILTLGSVATQDLAAGGIYQGVPANLVKMRQGYTDNNRPT